MNTFGLNTIDEMYDASEKIKSKFNNWEDESKYIDDCRYFENEFFLKIVKDVIAEDGNFLYGLLKLKICDEFDIEKDCCGISNAVYKILNYYFEKEIMLSFEDWLKDENGPIIMNERRFDKIFPEFKIFKRLSEKVQTANKIYKTQFKIADNTYEEYIYAYKFNFDIEHINFKKLKTLVEELQFCQKYNIQPKDEIIEEISKHKDIIEILLDYEVE